MNCNPSWWTATKPAPERDPLDAINTLADCLRQGAPVPEPAASLLLMGLQAPRSGQRTPVQIAAMERRNGMIRDLAELLPGTTGDKATARAAMVVHIDQLAGQIDLAAPDLPESARATVLAIIASARAEWIRSTSELVDRSLPEQQDDQTESTLDEVDGNEA